MNLDLSSYPENLTLIGLTLHEKYIGSKKHHKIQCNMCGHTWMATPYSRIQLYRNNGTNGCPECAKTRRYSENRANVIKLLQERFEILSEYDGSQTENKITVKNKTCGHTFESTPTNLLHRGVKCAVCNRFPSPTN